MNSAENINNAFTVVRKTYENIKELFKYLQGETAKRGDYELVAPASKFLRWKSDVDYNAWLTNVFILPFQKKSVERLENGWRNDAVYTLEVNLHDFDEPKIALTRFEYDNIEEWSRYSQYDYEKLYPSLYTPEFVNFDVDDGVKYSGTASATGASKYRGFKSVRGVKIALVDITAANAFDEVTGGFDRLDKEARES
jgi:hypothetical protein